MEYNFESIKLTNKNNKLMKESKRFKNKVKKIIKKVVKR